VTDHALQHPAVAAERSARNAVAAEMATAGRARFRPSDAWIADAHRARWSDADSTWVLASDDWATMQDDLACAEESGEGPGPAHGQRAFAEEPGLPWAIDPRAGAHGDALARLAVPVGAAEGAEAVRKARRRLRGSAPAATATDHVPAARTRRERLELAFWFAVGGVGGLMLAAAVRVAEVVLAWN
jgi:hypothetical protein